MDIDFIWKIRGATKLMCVRSLLRRYIETQISRGFPRNLASSFSAFACRETAKRQRKKQDVEVTWISNRKSSCRSRDREKGWRKEWNQAEAKGGIRYREQRSGIQPRRRDAAVKSLAQSASFWRWRYLRAIWDLRSTQRHSSLKASYLRSCRF